jgi:hypothetical protein
MRVHFILYLRIRSSAAELQSGKNPKCESGFDLSGMPSRTLGFHESDINRHRRDYAQRQKYSVKE